jgi:protein gp37
MVFVNSMSDLFHEDVPDDYIHEVADVMLQANWHTYQVLTKRSARMRRMLETSLSNAASAPQIWWGVSVENRRDGLPRIEDLRSSRALTRFLSVEPLLEDLGRLDLAGIHWVILGGESGPRCRLLEEDWVKSIRDQCGLAGVSFFFKQWGGLRKSKAGRSLDGQTYDEVPDRGSRVMMDNDRRKRLLAALQKRFEGQQGQRYSK